MNRNMLLLIAAPLFIMAHRSPAETIEPEESAPSFEVAVDYFGKYIWRGQNLADDPVIQPGASVSIGGLTAGIWGNLETTSVNGQRGEFTEYDYSLDYSADVPFIDGVSYSVGVIHYYFPSAGDTTELYWGFGFDLPLSPSVSVYHDVDDVDGTYVSVGIGHSIENVVELAPGIPVGVECSVSLGWGSASYNKAYWGTAADSAQLNDLALSVAFPIDVHGWSVVPSLNYVALVDDDVRSTDAFSTDSDYFIAGIGIAKSF